MINVHIAQRVLGVPLAIEAKKLDVILQVLGPKFMGQPLSAEHELVVQEDESQDMITSDPALAIVPIVGTLVNRTHGLDALSGLMSYRDIRFQIDSALEDPRVVAIALDVSSPGGEVSGLMDLADFIREAAQQKPMLSVVDEEAFSAAYALASATGNVAIPRTAGVGSVGVLAVHVDQSQHDAQEGFAYTFITSGSRKAEFNEHEPLSDDAKARLQAYVNQVYDLLATTVGRNMSLSRATLDRLQGGVVFGQDAVRLGLASRVQSKADALDAFIQQQFTRSLNVGAVHSQKEIAMKPKAKTVKILKNSAVGPTEVMTETVPQETQEDQTSAVVASQTSEQTPDLTLDRSIGRLVDVIVDGDEDTMSSSYVMSILSACKLAGKSQLAEKFLAKKMPLNVVQKALVDGQAHEDEAAEIVSSSAPPPAEQQSSKKANINMTEIFARRQKEMIGSA